MPNITPLTYVQIALSGPLRQLFVYKTSVPETNIVPGCRVIVPFGNRERTGIIVSNSKNSDYAPEKIKPIIDIIDEQPVLNSAQLRLAHWASQYYHHSLGDIYFSMLPKKLRSKTPFQLPQQTFWSITASGQTAELPSTAKKQRACLQLLKQSAGVLSEPNLRQQSISLATLKRLHDLGFIVAEQHIADVDIDSNAITSGPPLTDEQQSAIQAIEFNTFNSYVLNGITGSGKTEVYIQLAQQCLANNQQVLILVPEIGLTPQTIERFNRRLPYPIRTIHSGLNETEQMGMWSLSSRAIPQVVIATRSGLFVPLPKLGLIIVDEEHDGSYKQSSGWRYSARDLAIVRAKQANVPILLGSATPSLETRHLLNSGQYHELLLTRRPTQQQQPTYELLDIRKLPLDQGLSLPLIDRIQSALSRGDQVLVFLNRRGYAPVMMCHECGWSAKCQRCDSLYTLHQRNYVLRCHHCDARRPIPKACPDCGINQLAAVGQGTERIEESLRRHFPDISIARIDRDTTRNKGSMSEFVSAIKNSEYQLLIGTQMLAKGHHFPNLSMVAIVDMDGALFCADFRATERFGQLLKQVSGRAGRGNQAGNIVIQTRQPDHPMIHTLINHPYEHFSQQLLQQRLTTNWPPYSHLALLNSEATRENTPIEFLSVIKQRLSDAHSGVTLLGPIPALNAKRSGKYRFQLLFQSQQRAALHQALEMALEVIDSEKLSKSVRWSLDVDPQDLV